MAILPMREPTPISPESRPFNEIGTTGLKHWGGLLDEEFLRELRGPSGVRVYNEMRKNDAVVGASLFAYTNLAKGVKFTVVPALKSGRKGKEVAEFVSGCMFEDMSMSWRDTISEIFTFLPFGWSYFETVYKRRQGMTNDPTTRSRFNDNKIGWRKWAPRGQDTLWRWEMDESGGVKGMVQRASPTFVETFIPIEKSLLFRTISERGNPEGQSILRTAYQSFYYKRRFQIVRGIGVERDLAGLPVLTPPQNMDIWNPNNSAAVSQKALAEKLVRNIRRDEHEGVLKPFGWELELLGSSGSRQFDITDVIRQLNAETAMSMMTDFILVGHESKGAFNLSEDKKSTFGDAASSFLDNVCEVVNRFAIPRLVLLNGWDESLCPMLVHGPVSPVALTQLTTFVKDMVGAGVVIPDEPLEAYVRERGQLPTMDPGTKRATEQPEPSGDDLDDVEDPADA